MDHHALRRAALLVVGIALAGCSPAPHRATQGTPVTVDSATVPGSTIGSSPTDPSTTTVTSAPLPASGVGTSPTTGGSVPSPGQSSTTPTVAAPTGSGTSVPPTTAPADTGSSSFTATPEQCGLLRQAVALTNDPTLRGLAAQAGC